MLFPQGVMATTLRRQYLSTVVLGMGSVKEVGQNTHPQEPAA
jgi:hypothetical protein